ncbi:unnamed protein product [Polarella glacialis]|uniref:NADH:ubiquinone oxidoreductase intermediate-associated protein 30 domain-containing protein n=1 Tax=Polarella glacialis TaxID=89957 RepID=A0A813I759_POLGL|nr:unnamed protein product [Polarella glacialis]
MDPVDFRRLWSTPTRLPGRTALLSLLAGAVLCTGGHAAAASFVLPGPARALKLRRDATWPATSRHAATPGTLDTPQERMLAPLFSFTGDEAERAQALAQFERIDDVIMGGMSKSQLVDGGAGGAAWKGLIRTDGGGFCGQRTRPFAKPLNLTGADGIYISCRLSSDEDSERRVWKLSLRTGEGRGEVVYQAPYKPSAATMQPVFVPFSDFVLVRGPIAVPDAPRVTNVSAIYQIGFTCSKFVIGPTMLGLEGFRNGTFQLDVAELGAYAVAQTIDSPLAAQPSPKMMPEKEVQQNRPLLLKLLLPVLGLVFSEAGRRRRRAAGLLRGRGASRLDLVRLGWNSKRNLFGRSFLASALQTAGQGVSAVAGGILSLLYKVTLSPIVRLVFRRQARKQEDAVRKKRAEEEAENPPS